VGGGLSLLYTQKYLKIAKVHTTAWRFDNEGLVKINFCVKGHEKSLNAAFYNFKNLKICSLLTEI
jgi:hypothetical protein